MGEVFKDVHIFRGGIWDPDSRSRPVPGFSISG